MDVWEQDLQTKRENTRYNYRRYFGMFLERWGMEDGEELYQMRRADLTSEDTRDHENTERKVRVYMAEMLKEGYAAGTCRIVAKAVVSFFESQGLPIRIKAKNKPKGFSNGQRVALGDKIRTMWDRAPEETRLKTRGMLMFLKDSGIRLGDLALLNIEDYLEAQTVTANRETFKAFYVRGTEKTAAPAYIHIGPEAVEALDLYLEDRQEEDPQEPLFANRFGKRFEATALSAIFRRLGSKVGKKISGHSLRKFHTTMLQSAGMHDDWIKKLQGKSVGGSMGPYSRPEETGDLTPAYVNAYPKLRVFGEQASALRMEDQDAEIEALRRQVESGQTEIDDYKEELRRELDDYKKELKQELLGELRKELMLLDDEL